MAQGIIAGIRFVLDSSSPKMWGKEDAKDVAPWTAPKWILPMHELEELVNYMFSCMGPHRIPIIKAKNGPRNVQGDMLRDTRNVSVECSSHEVVIAKHECLLRIESDSNDVFRIG